MDARKRARYLSKRYKSHNPFEIIENLNVILIFCSLEGVRGFYQYFQRNNIIYINERLSDKEKLFVCAHELGHMFLHKKSNAIFMDSRTHFNTTKYENEADAFAIELLISDEDIAANREFTVEQIARIFGYHKKLIELRLNKYTIR